jgi:hypothetical protein
MVTRRVPVPEWKPVGLARKAMRVQQVVRVQQEEDLSQQVFWQSENPGSPDPVFPPGRV